jgi:hypothetical protein
MSEFRVTKVLLLAALAAAVATACAAPDADGDGEAPELNPDGLAAQQQVSDSGWTMDVQPIAMSPMGPSGGEVYGAVVFARTSGASIRSAGACLLNEAVSSAGLPVDCTTVTDCAGVQLPTGGFRYCLAHSGTSQKTCWIRPGSSVDYCTGSPASGGAAIAPGTYFTNSVPATVAGQYSEQQRWVMYGCFAGCTTIPGSLWYAESLQQHCAWWNGYWDSQRCWESEEARCTYYGNIWQGGACYGDQQTADCESQSVQGTSCLYYQWYDAECHCVI